MCWPLLITTLLITIDTRLERESRWILVHVSRRIFVKLNSIGGCVCASVCVCKCVGHFETRWPRATTTAVRLTNNNRCVNAKPTCSDTTSSKYSRIASSSFALVGPRIRSHSWRSILPPSNEWVLLILSVGICYTHIQLGLVYDPYQVAHDNDMMWYDTHIVVLWPTIDHQQQQSNCIALEKHAYGMVAIKLALVQR
mgnify:CR=1 FL=1